MRVSVTYRFGENMVLCKTYPSPKSLQEQQEGQEHNLLGDIIEGFEGADQEELPQLPVSAPSRG